MIKNILLVLLFWVPLHCKGQLPDFTDLVEKQGPAVVNISTTQTTSHSGAKQGQGQAQPFPNLPEDDPFFEFFRRFSPNPGQTPHEAPAQSLGSGFIISADGYILTNSHVVQSAEEITVKLTNKREYKAKLIGTDRRTDVALIKIEATNLPHVKIGDPARLRVGEWVVAIGSPFGFDNTVTAGIVSAKGRSLPDENFVPFIQTDVAVNPGNSGGPLFNMKGEVVGINSQIYSRTGGFMGLSFAIPIDMATEIAEQLKSGGKITRGRIGVVIQPVTKELADGFGLASPSGALINSVEKGGPAEKAGIEAGDVILRFDGKAVNASEDLPRIVGNTRPGRQVVVQLWRNKTAKEVRVTVSELSDDAVAGRGGRGGATPAPSASLYGMGISELSASQRKELKIEGGLLVGELQGSAVRAGIRRGDIILAVNNQDVKTVEMFTKIMSTFEKGQIVALLVRRGNNSLYLPFKIDSAN